VFFFFFPLQYTPSERDISLQQQIAELCDAPLALMVDTLKLSGSAVLAFVFFSHSPAIVFF
jgi:methylglyoxal synthase